MLELGDPRYLGGFKKRGSLLGPLIHGPTYGGIDCKRILGSLLLLTQALFQEALRYAWAVVGLGAALK